MTVPSLLSQDDLFLLAEGTWLQAYDKMGAHPRVVDGVQGTNFAVWAPEAESVSVVGDFNVWQPGQSPMSRRGFGGVWETFIPGVSAGDLYKFHISSRFRGHEVYKADPYAFAAEVRPATASIVYDLSGYEWGDREWMAERARIDQFARPLTIYEVHAGSWRRGADGRFLSFRELAHELVDYVNEQGFSHIELLPITEHPFDVSWGYQTTGYFAATSRFGSPHDFMYFVDHCHRHGVGVFLDWVPSHFAKEGHGLGYFDGTHLYEHADQRLGEHIGWGTFIFNYLRHEVLTFLLANANFWLREYHVDGLRVDAVASMLYLDYGRENGAWVPNRLGGHENLEAIEFLRRFNDMVHARHPGALTSAEESTAWPGVTHPTSAGGLGFDFKWNMGWMHDTLEYLSLDPIYRKYHQYQITFSFSYAFSERYVLPLSHDEVVHLKRSLLNKMPGDDWQRFATLRALFAHMYGHPGKKLLFMGGEFGQQREWAFAEALEWHLLANGADPRHRQLQQYVAGLNRLYAGEPALHERDTVEDGFAWIDGSDVENSVVAYLRRGSDPNDLIAIVCNWTPVPRANYPIGLPLRGRWTELLNSDDAAYGGSGVGNPKGVSAVKKALDGFEYSVRLTLPPLGVLWLKPEAQNRGS